jgi:O-6-methylguanine DNA methyltransferase
MSEPQNVLMQGRMWHIDTGVGLLLSVSFPSQLGRFQILVSQADLALVEVQLENESAEHAVGWRSARSGSRSKSRRSASEGHTLDSNAWVQVDRPLVREQPGALGLSTEDTDLLQVVDQAVEQLVAYSQGRLREFSLPLKFTGTEFQNSVWKALLEVPYGQTTTYGELAKRIGMPKGARAVGGALNRNPLGIVVPCHRVVGSDGAMVGFAGGIDVKKLLLELELRGKVG